MVRRRRSAAAASRAALAASAVAAALLVSACANLGGETSPNADGPDAGSRLDLAEASFAQVADSELALEIATHGAWDPADVKPSPARALCVWVRNELSKTAQGRLCVVPNARAASGLKLRYTTLDHRGRQTGTRAVPGIVQRPTATTIRARVSPVSLELVPGRYRWQVRSRSLGVDDRLPDATELVLRIALSTAPAARMRCFAAAAHDPLHPCENPKLRLVVVPTPDDAILSTNSLCTPAREDREVKPCEFGVPAVDAGASVALVGDSHAGQWRGALEYAAQHKRWHGVSITRSGCPMSRVMPRLTPISRRKSCLRWNAQLPGWFRRHPDIHTVFVSQHNVAAVVVAPGKSALETRAAGHRAAWNALPPSVRRIVVLRDTPLLGFQNPCVRAADARGQDPGDVCALARARVLRSDGAAIAARRLRSPRLRVIDMTPFFCSTSLCQPVIGGALVYKDHEHMTDVFSTSLGPYVLRAIDGL
jgi:hypothetical protein